MWDYKYSERERANGGWKGPLGKRRLFQITLLVLTLEMCGKMLVVGFEEAPFIKITQEPKRRREAWEPGGRSSQGILFGLLGPLL